MRHSLAMAELLDARAKLEHAAGIGRRNAVRTRGVDALHLLREQPHRHIRVDHVIDARAAAAEIGKAHLLQRKAGDAR